MMVTKMHRSLALLVLAATMVAGSPAYAHALLQKAVPAVGAEVSPGPAILQLHFSEGIELAFSGVAIAMADGMAITPRSLTLDPADDATLVVSLSAPLAPGRYEVAWHVVSVDTHKTQGHYGFTVKP